jgi:hypothetical protein
LFNLRLRFFLEEIRPDDIQKLFHLFVAQSLLAVLHQKLDLDRALKRIVFESYS